MQMIQCDAPVLVFPWAFSPRTCSVGKAGTHFCHGHRPEPVLGPAKGRTLGPVWQDF
jgi:hypothetical protein